MQALNDTIDIICINVKTIHLQIYVLCVKLFSLTFEVLNMKNKAPKVNKTEFVSTLKKSFPHTLPVFAGYLVLGFGFGLLLQSKGYNFLWAILMSITIYGGSMQYVGVDILSSGAGIITTAIMSLMIQARHTFYGLSLLAKYKDIGKTKPYLIFGITDETYSLVTSIDPPENTPKGLFYFWITLLDQCYWILGGAIGAIFGQMVHINTKGVDFSMTSLFVVILTDNLMKKKGKDRIPSFVGLGISFVCLMIFGAENFLIPAMVCIAIVLMLLRPMLSKNKEGDAND